MKTIAPALLMMSGAGFADAGEPQGFVPLRDVDPSIVQDMRYATARNFTAKPVPGYDAAECLLRRDAADALKRAQTQAKALGFSLKVYDCYRPERAVRAFVAWAKAPEDGRSKHFHPHLRKSDLVPRYIAPRSSHSTGVAVDVTLIAWPLSGGGGETTGPGDCTAPASERDSDGSVDMGTAFDCFDPKANTASPLVSSVQRKSRMMLKGIMEAAGFRNYAGEWWHFAFGGGK